MVTIGCASQVDSRRLQDEEGIADLMRAFLFAERSRCLRACGVTLPATYHLLPTVLLQSAIGNRMPISFIKFLAVIGIENRQSLDASL
jgi:hypothetical protein